MKKARIGIAVLAALALFVLGWPRPAAAFGLGFKFSGGYNSMAGGDINEGLKGLLDLQALAVQALGGSAHGDYVPFHGGMDVGGDLIFYFVPFFGLSLGASYITANSTTEFTASHPVLGTINATVRPKVKAMPVRGGIYFSIPMGSLVNLTLNGGVEYYLANARILIQSTQQPSGDREETDIDLDSSGKFGFYAGLGLEIRFHPNLSLLLEGRGRYAQIDGFKGSETVKDFVSPDSVTDGTLWYAKINFGPIGDHSLITLSDTTPPSNPAVLELREAQLAFDGFTAIAGLMIRF